MKSDCSDRSLLPVLRILVIDDDEVDRMRLARLLRQVSVRRFVIEEAFDKASGIARIQASNYDCVLLDFRLPDGDGIELLRDLEAVKGECPPIIVNTVMDDETVGEQLVALGAQDYLVKGRFDSAQLFRTIRYAMQRHRLIRERIALLAELESAKAFAEKAKEQAETANKTKSELLNMAAHDIRNPISGIKSLSEFLIEDIKKAVPSDKQGELSQCASHILRSSVHMLSLINDLLSSEQINAIDLGESSIEFTENNLSDVAAIVIDLNEYRARHKNISIEVSIENDLIAAIDGNRITEAFDNLVSNAIKYSPKNSAIKICLAKTTDGYARFSVQDHGLGLSKEDQNKLFKKFCKLTPRPTDNESSSGLGLSIAKQIIDLHKGRIWCESEKGHGCTFTIELPIVQ
jgi:signal transduction histidine kinase